MVYQYENIDVECEGVKKTAFSFTEGPYEGIMFLYGKIHFTPCKTDPEKLVMKFEYQTLNGDFPLHLDKTDFVASIGDLLVELIEEGVRKNNLVYTGGIDDESEFGKADSTKSVT